MAVAFILGFHLLFFRILLFLRSGNPKNTINNFPEEEMLSRQQKVPLLFYALIIIALYLLALNKLYGFWAFVPVISAMLCSVFVKKEDVERVNFDGILFLININWKRKSLIRNIDNFFVLITVLFLIVDLFITFVK